MWPALPKLAPATPGSARSSSTMRRPSRASASAAAVPITPAPMTAMVSCSLMAPPYTIYDPASNRGYRFMSAFSSCAWSGVFPAATTQFGADMQVDLPATQKVHRALLEDGVHGLVLMGTVGEGNSLTAQEKRSVLAAAVEASEGKVPVIAGVSEFTTAAGMSFARDAERLGASGLMVLPAMVYVPP